MLINNWYIAAEADDLTDQPLGVRLLGLDYVLFRDGSGARRDCRTAQVTGSNVGT